MTELLPCPFCGEAPKAEGKYVGCVTEDCLMEGLTFILSAWNTRAPIPATPGEDRVREAELERVAELARKHFARCTDFDRLMRGRMDERVFIHLHGMTKADYQRNDHGKDEAMLCRLLDQALAAPAPVCVCGHSKADHAEKHGWECSEECACLRYTPAPAPAPRTQDDK